MLLLYNTIYQFLIGSRRLSHYPPMTLIHQNWPNLKFIFVVGDADWLCVKPKKCLAVQQLYLQTQPKSISTYPPHLSFFPTNQAGNILIIRKLHPYSSSLVVRAILFLISSSPLVCAAANAIHCFCGNDVT